MKFGGVGK